MFQKKTGHKEVKNIDTRNQRPDKSHQTKPENEVKSKTVPFYKLFRFASNNDWLLIIIGSLSSILNGAATPLFTLFMGDITDSFGKYSTPDQLVDVAGELALKILGVAIVTFVTSYLGFGCWMIVGERQAIAFRKQYFKSLLVQEIAFYDSINPNELSSKIADECFLIQSGVGEKVSIFQYSISMFISGFIIGYLKGWQLALVLTGFLPILTLTGTFYVYAMQKQNKFSSEVYNKAGAIAEEALNAIRTIVSLGGQNKEVARYKEILGKNQKQIRKFMIFSGAAMGSLFFAMFGVYALGFFMGSVFIEHQVINPVSDAPYSGGDVLTVFFSIVFAGFTISQTAPAVKAFGVAKEAATKAFEIINRRSRISIHDHGHRPTQIEGSISFRDVSFAYPAKPEKNILDKITFDIRKNEKTAFVGESGCGKTTCMQLIERFYDIECGSIKLDEYELKDLNLKRLRESIGYVGQEPVLFATSIKENLLMAKDNATDQEIWEALRKANALEFVKSLPDQLNTYVGTNGTQLSGGQKQRLAIARALLKNPTILLLDEATSALDRKNEIEIQETLDKVSEGRTTIVIAHRLTTVQNADHIIVFDQGRVVEEGRHSELMENKGKYYALINLQLQAEEKEKVEIEFENEENDFVHETKEGVSQAVFQSRNQKNHNGYQIASRSFKDIEGEEEGKLAPDSRRNLITLKPQEEKQRTEKTPKKKIQPVKQEKGVFVRLFKYNKSERPLIILGIFVAIINGIIFPSLAIILSNMLDVFALPTSPDFREKANLLSLGFLILSVAAFVANSLQVSLFTYVGESLSRNVRIDVFHKFLKMPIGWFDESTQSPGALAGQLATDANLINCLTSSTIGIFVQAAASFIVGMIIALLSSWQLTLISLALSPLMIISGKMQAQLSQGFSAGTDKSYQESVAFVAEAVNNMRTVASFSNEDKILMSYSTKLDHPLKAAIKKGNMSGFAFGLSQFFNFGIYAIVFYLGAIFIRDINLSYLNMFQSIFGIMFAAFGTGNAFQFAPDLGTAKNAAVNIFKTLDIKPEIDLDNPKQTVRTPINGNIEFRNVWFKYPTREKQIFKGLSFHIRASSKVALVGPSGCGKSTILALLQRFYDPDEGEILVDGTNIKKYDLRYLRECYGVVSQEPVLFNGTIEYNIKYTKESATDEEMKEAAKQANAIGFIENNEFDVINKTPELNSKYGKGFQRMVGPKGSQLSGGQKQRIAIARAILKNPAILILDEATSALDSQNEKVVQESLDRIMKDKTSIIVAHRISTIKDADEIIVFNEGEIVESGKYEELVRKEGIFYKLERGIPLEHR